MKHTRFRVLMPLLLCSAAPLAAQSITTPHWSSLLGGNGREEITTVCRDANGLVTVAGFTNSSDLPVFLGSQNPNPFQSVSGGGYDGFVARFDPSLPPALQLLWCSYLGGIADEFLFDAQVAPDGTTTVVGVTESTDFPAAAGQPQPSLGGRSDGFVCQISPRGGLLQTSMLLGGSGHDRLGGISLDPAGGGALTLVGTTESSDLPGTAGGLFPTPRGGATDAFVMRIDPTLPPAARILWATYLGGSQFDGNGYQGLINGSGWEPYWDGVEVVHDIHGRITVAFQSLAASTNAPTTAGAFQPAHAGGQDAYVAQLSEDGSRLLYASFLGGTSVERLLALVVDASTGWVYVGGQTRSANLPTTQGALQPSYAGCTGNCRATDQEGYLYIIDPARSGAAGLVYGTYFGGTSFDDGISGVAVDPAGGVTVAGWSTGGGFPSTPRSMNGPGTASYSGVVARILPEGNGQRDLLFSSFAGSSDWTWFNDVAIDEFGDAIAVGMTNSDSLPLVNPFQSTRTAGDEGLLMHVPLLPGCVQRSDRALAVAACPPASGRAAPTTRTRGAPVPGATFSLLMAGSDRAVGATGYLVLGMPGRLPIPSATLLVQPLVTVAARSAGPLGYLEVDLPIPAGLPAACPWGLAAQWVELADPSWCAGVLPYQTTERLGF